MSTTTTTRFLLINKTRADILYFATPAVLALIAFKFSGNHVLHFQKFLECFALLMFGVTILSALFEVVMPILGKRIQTDNSSKRPNMLLREVKEMTGTLLVLAQLLAWPLQRNAEGKQTAFVDSFEQSIPLNSYPLFVLKMIFVVLGADAWTYWKHFILHTRHFFWIHATHHSFADPSTFAAFALHPFESLYTFCPVLLFQLPGLDIHAPTYLPLLMSWGVLNLYLHCGYTIDWLENVLPRFFLNTSAFHNIHHEKTVTHLGELLTLWDSIVGTDMFRAENLRGLFPVRRPMWGVFDGLFEKTRFLKKL